MRCTTSKTTRSSTAGRADVLNQNDVSFCSPAGDSVAEPGEAGADGDGSRSPTEDGMVVKVDPLVLLSWTGGCCWCGRSRLRLWICLAAMAPATRITLAARLRPFDQRGHLVHDLFARLLSGGIATGGLFHRLQIDRFLPAIGCIDRQLMPSTLTRSGHIDRSVQRNLEVKCFSRMRIGPNR